LEYTYSQLVSAYRKWVSIPYSLNHYMNNQRRLAWLAYVDIRDCQPMGSALAKEISRHKTQDYAQSESMAH